MLAKKAKEVLDLLQEQGLLKELILIGSWCCHFYIPYFGRKNYLIPRLGPTPDDPRKIPQLEINAMPLRHTYVLTAHVIKVEEDGLSLILPHPLAFALHKLFISSRRKDKGKAI